MSINIHRSFALFVGIELLVCFLVSIKVLSSLLGLLLKNRMKNFEKQTIFLFFKNICKYIKYILFKNKYKYILLGIFYQKEQDKKG